jgi:hypothetical protein
MSTAFCRNEVVRLGLALWFVSLIAGPSLMHAGGQSAIRWIVAAQSRSGEVVSIGQEIHMSTSKKGRSTERGAIDFRRGNLALRRSGSAVPVAKGGVLSDSYIATATYDTRVDVFTIIANPWMRNGQSRCYRITVGGDLTECRLPLGYKYKGQSDYLWDYGKKLRYVDLRSHPWEFWEYDVESGNRTRLVEGVRTMYMAIKDVGESGRNKTVQYGIPSPDESMNIRIIESAAEVCGAQGTKTIDLDVVVQRVDELAWQGSRACESWPDSVADTPVERSAFVWSHDSRYVYWCGVKKESGVVIDVRKGSVILAPCMRGVTWSDDNVSVIGTMECGHSVDVWHISQGGEKVDSSSGCGEREGG